MKVCGRRPRRGGSGGAELPREGLMLAPRPETPDSLCVCVLSFLESRPRHAPPLGCRFGPGSSAVVPSSARSATASLLFACGYVHPGACQSTTAVSHDSLWFHDAVLDRYLVLSVCTLHFTNLPVPQTTPSQCFSNCSRFLCTFTARASCF